jgi:hypothetical protein
MRTGINSQFVTWQGGLCFTSARNHTWHAVKSLYR